MNFGLQTAKCLPILNILFRPQSIAHALGGINMAPAENIIKTILGLSAAQIQSPKNVNLAIASRRAASLIATFSSILTQSSLFHANSAK